MPSVFDPAALLRSIGDRVNFWMSADQTIADVAVMLKDTHRILMKLETAVDSLSSSAKLLEDTMTGVTPGLIGRLEGAVANIERATLSVEKTMSAAVGAMPKLLRNRLSLQGEQEGT